MLAGHFVSRRTQLNDPVHQEFLLLNGETIRPALRTSWVRFVPGPLTLFSVVPSHVTKQPLCKQLLFIFVKSKVTTLKCVPSFFTRWNVFQWSSRWVKGLSQRRSQDFSKGGHTMSKWGYSPDYHYGQGIVRAFSPPVVGCLVKKRLAKGGSWALQKRPWLRPC